MRQRIHDIPWSRERSRSSHQLKAFPRSESRAENRRVHRIGKAVADAGHVGVFGVHVESPDTRVEKSHNLIVAKSLSEQYHLIGALFVELAQPRATSGRQCDDACLTACSVSDDRANFRS
jgi:hypothetical protein